MGKTKGQDQGLGGQEEEAEALEGEGRSLGLSPRVGVPGECLGQSWLENRI